MGCTFDKIFGQHDGCEPEPELDTGQAVKLINGLARIRLPVLVFAGGEPLLRNDLFQLARAARDGGIFSVLFTNGSLIGIEEADGIESVFPVCMLSVDGPEKHNDMVRGEGSYRKAAAGLEILLRRRRKTSVSIACVVNRMNILSLAGFAEEMRKAGVDAIKFQANFLPEYHPSEADAIQGMEQLIEIKKKYPKFIKGSESYFRSMADYFSGGAQANCFAQNIGHIVISPSGKYSLCCYRNSVIEQVKEPSDLLRVNPDACAHILSGCSGCHRYDNHVLSPLFDGPFNHIRPAEIIESIKL